MLVDDELIALAKEQPLHAVKKLQERFRLIVDTKGKPTYNEFTEAYAFLEAIFEAGLFSGKSINIEKIELKGNREDETAQLQSIISNVFRRVSEEIDVIRIEDLRSKFRVELGSTFSYEFSQGDLDRVQELINALRNELMNCNGLEDGHRQRLMRRLEILQTELHKKVSNLDRFWGLIGDAGVVLGKLGQDAKPLVDRIREITSIVWQTQARAEELPSGLPPPLIGKDTSEEQ
jgi:hypothetical protein